MQAVVMAGGQGSRLRPLTSNQPKPMLPIVGRPMMQHVLRLLRRHGMTDVVATVQFLGSIIRNYFGDGSDLGLSIRYAVEEEPLGTAGSVKNAEDLLDDTFLVISGDALTDIDLSDAMAFHGRRGAAATVVLKRVEDPLEFGIVIADEEGRIDRFLEKPGWGEVFSDTINTGIYIVDPEVLRFVPESEEFDFAQDLFPLLLDKGLPLYGYAAEGYWTDVGNLEAYQAAHRDVLDGRVDLELEGFALGEGVWLGDGAEIDPEANVSGPVFIGEDSRVEAGATLLEYSVVGRNVVVKSGAFLHRAIVHDNAYLGPSVSLRGCVVGRNADVKHGARLEEGVVVSDDCLIGEGAVLNPQVKVYPFKGVDPGALVTQSIIWESRGARSLFGERGISGLVNVDVTPEMAVRLGLAFGSTLPRRSIVSSCRDTSRAARVVKRAMVAGLTAAGVNVHDLELIPSAVARFYARSAGAAGGIAVRSAPYDPASVEVQFFDGNGVDIDRASARKVERAFSRDDFRRAYHHEIGELSFPARGREYYARGLVDAVAADAIRESGPKLVVDYLFGSAALTAPGILGRVGADVLAVNAVLDEQRMLISERELDAHLGTVARLVTASRADLGAVVDGTGETLRLVDDRGRIVEPTVALLAMVDLVAATEPAPRVAVPVSASRAVEEIVGRAGGTVIRTRIASSEVMGTAERREVALAGTEDGGYVFPAFLAAFDAVLALVRALELLVRTGRSLSQVIDGLPPVHVARVEVPTPWEAKGTVMRRLLERVNGQATDTTDGVKTFRGSDWALVVPDPTEPVVRVWAEAGSDRGAYELAGEFGTLVEELRDS